MKGGHQGHAQLLTELRQAEIQGRKGEAGVHEIGLQPLQGFPQLPLRPGGRDRVDLRFDQIRQADVRVVGQQRCVVALRAARVIEMDEVHLMPAFAQGLRGADPVGHIPAEGRLLAEPRNLRQAGWASSGENAS